MAVTPEILEQYPYPKRVWTAGKNPTVNFTVRLFTPCRGNAQCNLRWRGHPYRIVMEIEQDRDSQWLPSQGKHGTYWTHATDPESGRTVKMTDHLREWAMTTAFELCGMIAADKELIRQATILGLAREAAGCLVDREVAERRALDAQQEAGRLLATLKSQCDPETPADVALFDKAFRAVYGPSL